MYTKKSRLVFNIGVTGHRNISFYENNYLEELCLNILKFILDTTKEVQEEVKELYTSESPKLCLLTCLAEGFDRISAHAALHLGYEIQCTLPFSTDDYTQDFNSQESKDEFYSLLQKASAIYELDFGRNDLYTPYLNAGTVLVEHTDILLAFWDGTAAKGPGGTGEIVELAKEKSIPIIYIGRDMKVACGKDTLWKEALKKEIRTILNPCTDDSYKDTFPFIYFNENLERKSYVPLYDYIIKFFSPKPVKNNSEIKAPNVNYDKKAFTYGKQYYDSYFAEADSLAIYYAGYYRSAGALRSLIPLLATVALAIGFYWRWGENSNIVNVIGFLLQAVLLYWLVRVVGEKNEKNKWHQKFIDYRILAECIKNQSYLSPFGITLREIEISAYNKNDSISWINWYLRNVVRGLGLPNMTLDMRTLEESLSFINIELISNQINYHSKNSKKINIVGRNIERLGVFFFTLGAIFTVIRVIVHYACQINPNLTWLPSPSYKIIKLPTFINMISLLLPAFGAAAFSLGSQAGFVKLVQRHEYMKEQLTVISDDIRELKNESFIKVRKKMLKVITFMINEVADWRMFIKSKGITKR